MAIRDYMVASPCVCGKAARKTRVSSLQKLDTKQHTSGQKLVSTKSHDPNNVGIAKKVDSSMDPGFNLLASSAKNRFT